MNALTLAQAAATVGSYHRSWGWYAIGLMAFVGLWGLILSVLKRAPGRIYWWAFGIATTGIMAQVVMGIYAFSVGGIQPGNQHVFYGVVIMFTLAFAYIYRAQLAKRPALSYGLLALFLMGLGMRAISNFGQNF
jgi:hypothetical protein